MNVLYIRAMRIAAWATSVILSSSVLFVRAQNDTVVIKGNIVDYYTHKPISGVSIINPISSRFGTTDSKGAFYERINKRDTLFLFYPGYRTTKFSVSDSTLKAEYVFHFVLEPLSTGLSQGVVIRAPKTLEQIENDRKNLGKTPHELDKPEEDVFTSPISALYDLLSARSKEREKLKKQMVEDDRRRIFRELLNYYNEKKLIDLPEDHYDSFIDFCNLPIEFLKYNSDYEIAKTITALYNKYGRLNGLIK